MAPRPRASAAAPPGSVAPHARRRFRGRVRAGETVALGLCALVVCRPSASACVYFRPSSGSVLLNMCSRIIIVPYPRVAQLWPNSGHVLPNAATCLPLDGQICPTLLDPEPCVSGHCGSIPALVAEVDPTLADRAGPAWSIADQLWSTSTQTSEDVFGARPTIGRARPKFGPAWPFWVEAAGFDAGGPGEADDD